AAASDGVYTLPPAPTAAPAGTGGTANGIRPAARADYVLLALDAKFDDDVGRTRSGILEPACRQELRDRLLEVLQDERVSELAARARADAVAQRERLDRREVDRLVEVDDVVVGERRARNRDEREKCRQNTHRYAFRRAHGSDSRASATTRASMTRLMSALRGSRAARRRSRRRAGIRLGTCRPFRRSERGRSAPRF